MKELKKLYKELTEDEKKVIRKYLDKETYDKLSRQDMNQKQWKKQKASESICDQCGEQMKVDKKPRKKYGKHNTTYTCEFCGHTHRKRTQNEILRDVGERDHEY